MISILSDWRVIYINFERFKRERRIARCKWGFISMIKERCIMSMICNRKNVRNIEVDRRIFLWILKNYSIKSRLKQIRTSCTFFFFFRNDYSRQDNRIHFCAFHSRIVYWDTIFLCLLKNKTPFSFRLKLIDDGEMSKVIRIKDIIKNNDKKNFLVPLLHSQNGIWQFPLFLSFVWILKKKKIVIFLN